jgi:hypothetical protein
MIDSLKRAWALSRRPPIDELIREVARRSMTEIHRRMSTAANTMSEAELRGYVRARAARPVRCEAERLATEQGWQTVLTDSIVASALERAVYQVVYQARMQPVVAPSAAHVTLRAVA